VRSLFVRAVMSESVFVVAKDRVVACDVVKLGAIGVLNCSID
jgi:hypothetical protein